MTCLRIAARMGALITALAVLGCEAPPYQGQAHADAQTRLACQQRAEQAYEQQNRAEIYSPPAAVNTPYSSNYAPGESGRGLADLFAHDRMVSDCVRNTGTQSDRTPSPPPADE